MTALTLPMIAVQIAAPLDTLRAQIRRNPSLARLGKKVAGVKFYEEAEVQIIRSAYASSRSGRERLAATA